MTLVTATLNSAKRKILLVDSSGSRRRLRVDALGKRGVDVTCAADVAEARMLWHPTTYALVLFDARHEAATALEFCREMKSTNGGQLTAFLVGKSEYVATAPAGFMASDSASSDGQSMARMITTACEGVPRRGRFQEAIWRMSLLRSSKPAQEDARPRFPVRVQAPEIAVPPISFGEAIRQLEIEQEADISEAE